MSIYIPSFSEILESARHQGQRCDVPEAHRGLRFWVPMQERGGLVVHDVSPYGSHGTFSSMGTTNWDRTEHGGAIRQDGVASYDQVLYGDPAALKIAGPITVSTWFNLAGGLNYPYFLQRNIYGTGSAGSWWIGYYSAGILRGGVVVTGGTEKECTFTLSPYVGYTHHWAMTYDRQYVRTYLDGVLVGTPAATTAAIQTGASYVSTGSLYNYAGNGNALNGKVWNQCVWDRALTEPQLRTLVRDPWAMGRMRRRVWPAVVAAGPVNLTPDAATCSVAADSVGLLQTHALAPDASTAAVAADSVAITQVHALALDASTSAVAADSIGLAQTHDLAVDSATASVAADSVVIVQHHSLAVDDAAAAVSADSVGITQDQQLAPTDASAAVAADSVPIVQQHQLALDASTAVVAADSVSLVSESHLAVSDSTCSVAADSVAIVQHHALAVDSTATAVAADSVDLTQLHQMLVDAVTAAVAADSVTYIRPPEPGPLRRGDPGSVSLLHRQPDSEGGQLRRGERTSRPLRRQGP